MPLLGSFEWAAEKSFVIVTNVIVTNVIVTNVTVTNVIGTPTFPRNPFSRKYL
jgi:hypothetical protein